MTEYIGSETGDSKSPAREVAVASGVSTFSGDFLTLSSGKVTNASINKKRLLGVQMGGDSRNPARSRRVSDQGYKATGTADGKVKVLVNIEENGKYLVKADATLSAANEGKFFNLHNTAYKLITSTGVAITDGNTITVGTQTYTFKTTLSAGPAVVNEVLIGASASASLDNLKLAINAGSGAGTNYATGTTANTTATATTKTSTTLLLEAIDTAVTDFTTAKVAVTLDISAADGGPGYQTVINATDDNLGQLILIKANPGIRGTGSNYGIFQIAQDYKDSVAALS